MTRPEFLEEITTNFAELYVGAFFIRHMREIKNSKYLKEDFEKSLSLLDKILKEKSVKDITKNNNDNVRQAFIETIANGFGELYFKTFIKKYSKNFKDKKYFEGDYAKSLSLVDEKIKEEFIRKY